MEQKTWMDIYCEAALNLRREFKTDLEDACKLLDGVLEKDPSYLCGFVASKEIIS